MSREKIPYRIIGVYDSETTNIRIDGKIRAFPILHQVGMLRCEVENVTPENVHDMCDVMLFRHALDLYAFLDGLLEQCQGFVPVICCHNLSFDMYGLSVWLNRHDVRVLAKSPRKPITFTVKREDGSLGLVIWDTAIFSQQSLERMGMDAGYEKGVGEWDYNLIRTPETPLSKGELDYAKRDIYALCVWVSWWLGKNPDILPGKLGLNVVTKTGIVRERRKVRFFKLKNKRMRYSIGKMWLYRCRTEAPKSDDELYTMLACTRGGFTFVSMHEASKPFNFDDDRRIYGFDATSMHPAQMVSHVYPVEFHESTAQVLNLAFDIVCLTNVNHVLEHWEKPFSVAFNACFHFEGLRPRECGLADYGVFPLASARYVKSDDDNGDRGAYVDAMYAYKDTGVNVKCAFGKIISADSLDVYLTELGVFEMAQFYEWDNVEAMHGYYTGRFTKPSDYDVVSVMQFYKAKDAFKEAREMYYEKSTIENGKDLVELGISDAIVRDMVSGTLPSNDVEAVYLGLKADLNSLFGINASNEYRRDTVLGENGITYSGEFGIANKPKNPKVWYQFGQRIVGWSRIAQVMALHLVSPYIDNVVNGDTDSIKVIARKSELQQIENSLSRYADAVDKAKKRVCSRVKAFYPKMYSPLDGIGHYLLEFETKRFCASWNKAYCIHQDEKGFSFTLAGIPTRKRVNKASCFIGVNGYADRLYELGWSFEDICNLLLGYNVTYSHDLIRLNARCFPEWGEMVFERVTDHEGESTLVSEPTALALYPMAKTVNDTSSADNHENMLYALSNNPDVNIEPKLIYPGGVMDFKGFEDDFLQLG